MVDLGKKITLLLLPPLLAAFIYGCKSSADSSAKNNFFPLNISCSSFADVSQIIERNYLIVGIDACGNSSEFKCLADAIKLVRVGSVTHSADGSSSNEIYEVSVPRDLLVTKETIADEKNLGVTVGRYLVVNFDGFKSLIDEVGGIDVYVREALDSADPLFSFDEGLHHFNGEEALRYARVRLPDNDFKRIERQNDVLLAFKERVFSTSMIPTLPQLIQIIYKSVLTDIEPCELPFLVQLALSVDAGDIHTEVLNQGYGGMVETMRGPTWAITPDWGTIRGILKNYGFREN